MKLTWILLGWLSVIGLSGPAAARQAHTIDVLVAFTNNAATRIEQSGAAINVVGTSDLEAFAQEAVHRTNAAFDKSGLLQEARLSLVGVYKTSSERGRGAEYHVRQLVNQNDGVFDDVHTERDRVNADVAVLIYSARRLHNECGMVLASPGRSSTEGAFAVVHWLRAIDPNNDCFAHEVGHMLGATHENSECGVLFSGAYYDNRRSIMGHPSAQCPLSLPFYSWANVLEMSRFAPTVAEYRDATPPVFRKVMSWHAISPNRPGAAGFVRIENLSPRNDTADIRVRDANGTLYPPVTVDIAAHSVATVHLNTIAEEIGETTGAWVLHSISTLQLRSMGTYAYGSGWLTRTDLLIPPRRSDSGEWVYRPQLFNAASNRTRRSVLYLRNPFANDAEVRITARDDAGRESDAALTFTLPRKWGTRVITAAELEEAWGDGHHKWRPEIFTTGKLRVSNLLVGQEGFIASLH